MNVGSYPSTVQREDNSHSPNKLNEYSEEKKNTINPFSHN